MSNRISAPVTLSYINAIQPGDVIHDTKLSGFGARRQTNAISYFVKLRVGGQQRWITIGQHGRPDGEGGTWTPDSARRKAIKIMGNPALADKPALPVTTPTRPMFNDVADAFIKMHGAKYKPRTAEEVQRIIRLHLKPAFGHLEIAALTRTHAETAHAGWKDKPRAANHALAILSKLMSWAEEHGYRNRDTNPCRRIPHYPQNNRERFLQPQELARLGTVLKQVEKAGAVDPYAIAAIKLLIFTGARLSEILTLRWSYVDLQRQALLLPDSKTGQKTIPLNAAAVAVLKKLPKIDKNPHVIVGRKPGSRLINLQKPWRYIRSLAKLDDVRIHDLRHTFASVGVAAGGSLPIIGRALGHSQVSTTQRYAHLTDTPVHQLTQLVGERLADALNKKKRAARPRP
jgi:integrase